MAKAAFLVLAVALIPSAWLGWTARDLPHLGYFHDDAVYWISARSLADGAGYRLLSFPGEPFQTKYPPLYPLVLSAAWLAPGSVEKLAMLLNWLMLPLLAILSLKIFDRLGLSRRAALALSAALAVNPFLVFFAASIMSDLMFTCLLLAALLMAERASRPESRTAWAIGAGLLAGASYLTRAAALPLLVTTPALFVWRKQPARAILFAAAMLPAVAGWQLWVRAHLSPASDPVSLFYLNYTAFYFENMSLASLPLFVWKNLGDFFLSLGNLILFHEGSSFGAMTLRRLLAAAAIAGAIRLARRHGLTHYHLFAAGYIGILLVWHYPPKERFLVPVFPLLLAGFWTELAHLASLLRATLRRPERNQRAAAWAAAAGLAALGFWWAIAASTALGVFLPELIGQQRRRAAAERPAYRWISENLPPGAAFLAQQDPVLYLATGRKAIGAHVAPKLSYAEDAGGLKEWFLSFPELARQHGARYLLLTPHDFERDLPEPQRAAFQKFVRQNAAFQPVYESPQAAVYRIAPE